MVMRSDNIELERETVSAKIVLLTSKNLFHIDTHRPWRMGN